MFSIFQENGFNADQTVVALESVVEGIGNAALWIAIALAVILVAVGIVTNFKFHDKFRTFIIVAVSILTGFAVAFGFVLLYLTFTAMSLENKITTTFWLGIGLLATFLVASVVCSLIKIFKPKFAKYALFSAIGIIVAYVIVFICVTPIEDYYPPIGGYGLYATLTAIIVLTIAVLAFVGDLKRAKSDSTKSLTYAGICIAIAFALSYIKFFDGPSGGSVTLASMLPIMLYSYMFGTKKGVLAGLVYGLLQFIQSPVPYEGLQIFLDYPIAFSALGVAGVFRNCKLFKGNQLVEFLLGILLAGTLRFLSSFLCGYFIWGVGVSSPVLNSFLINSAILIDAVICAVVGVLLFLSKSLMLFVNGVNVAPAVVSEPQETVQDDEKQPTSENKDE